MISKETILKYLSQEDIMNRYFPYEVSLNKNYKNPFRQDKNPSCNFSYAKSGVLYFVDWARGTSYDCFNIVGEIIQDNNFQRILKRIDKDFQLNLIPTTLKLSNKTKVDLPDKLVLEKDIKINSKLVYTEFKEFNEQELKFWNQYNITIEDLHYFNVRSVKRFWFNDIDYIDSTLLSPIFYYPVTEKDFQLYCPRRKTRFYSFFNSYQLLGLNFLPESDDILIITSSFKDIMILHKLGFPAIAPSSETTPILEEDLINLAKRFKTIYVNYNNDEAGIRATNKLIEDHINIDFKIITNKHKDPSDDSKYLGLDFVLSNFKKQL